MGEGLDQDCSALSRLKTNKADLDLALGLEFIERSPLVTLTVWSTAEVVTREKFADIGVKIF